jgi:hypothetical protein
MSWWVLQNDVNILFAVFISKEAVAVLLLIIVVGHQFKTSFIRGRQT